MSVDRSKYAGYSGPASLVQAYRSAVKTNDSLRERNAELVKENTKLKTNEIQYKKIVRAVGTDLSMVLSKLSNASERLDRDNQ